MVTRQIELTEEQDRALKELAAAGGRTVSELIQRGLDELIQNQPVTDREEIKRRAIAAIGRYRSDVTDLAVNHDHYLEEAFGD